MSDLKQESRGPVDKADRIAKAESWLSGVVDQIGVVDDLEALVYLRSRGIACDDQINSLAQYWKDAEQAAFEDYQARDSLVSTDDIVAAPPMSLRDFWGGASLRDHSNEATMLRTAEWCEIHGFDPWWQRIARTHRELLLRAGVENPVAASYWLFSMLRSDYATRTMEDVLGRSFESISLLDTSNRWPWMFASDKPKGQQEHLPCASAIAFASHRLAARDQSLTREAIERLFKHQDSNGAWRTWTDDTAPSVGTTAMVLHALGVNRPHGWQRIAVRARDWLMSVQRDEGYWTEKAAPGSVHLTVLVLDAISLADGESRLAFRPAQNRDRAPIPPHESTSAESLAPDDGPRETPEPNLETAQGRTAAVKAYQEEVLRKTDKRLSKTDIWKKAGYKSRTEFERWQRGDSKTTETAHRNLSRILREKPHLR